MRHCNREPGGGLARIAQRIRHPPAEPSARGSAGIEFVFLGVLLLLPVLYLIVALAQLQGAAFAAAGAADQAGKVYVREATQESAELRAEQAVLLALRDFGLQPEQAELRIACEPADCQAAGTRVTVVITVRVPLPLLPSLPGFDRTGVSLAASASQMVGRFR